MDFCSHGTIRLYGRVHKYREKFTLLIPVVYDLFLL